jgi:hypothetical protein
MLKDNFNIINKISEFQQHRKYFYIVPDQRHTYVLTKFACNITLHDVNISKVMLYCIVLLH